MQKASLVTTEFVLLEVADALSAPTIRTQTVALIRVPAQPPVMLLSVWMLHRSLVAANTVYRFTKKHNNSQEDCNKQG